MPQIRFDKVTFGYSDILFQDVTLSIGDGDRIGIVGNNGSGKSTLLQCIAGLIEPLKGSIICPKNLKLGFIEQHIPKKFYEMNIYDVMSEAIPAYDKHRMIWKVDVALDIFKAPQAIRQKSIQELSGGWQRLALIARTVLSDPDLLLLDEPTNHLDVAKIFVLERWLNEQVYDIPMLSISHDRSFLANCTNKTLFLRDKTVREYRYSYAHAICLLNEDDRTLVAKRSKEVTEMNRLKRSAHILRQIGVNNYSAAALKKSIQVEKRAEKIEMQLTNIHTEEKRAIKLDSSSVQTKKLISFNKVNIISPDGVLLFYIEQLDILRGDRLIILGSNGSGKSQFLQYLQKACAAPDDARMNGVIITPTIKLGYIDQHLSCLPLEKSLQDYFLHEFHLGDQKTTSILVTAGFPVAIQRTKLALLSHGQRARAAFLALHLTQPNFYVMDEPTNHLDIVGQEQLESEILKQEAASIVVSHDRVFTQNIGTRFYVIDNKKLSQIDLPTVYYKRLI